MNRERNIFLDAMEKTTPEEREAYARSSCGDDAGLFERVMELLRSSDRAGDFLRGGGEARNDSQRRTDAILAESPGSVIGRYKLLQEIGEGGFGRVYMAEQREPVKRKVALKIIKLGMDTKQVVGRFEAERQALAMMEHPNIARVLDGGATDTGRPYFVMELVRGVSITQFCDENQLTTEERLRLFVQVCDAIHHAHQKGVIHRDIKPSNVLITMHDDKPVPKVIDFGIAKAIGQDLTDKTIFTRYHEFIGTPAYMSPEQTQLSGLDIDTRSDIYSLGVLLYELLTGRTPFDAHELLSASYDEIRRRIREDEPLKPSTRLHTLAEDDCARVARHRKSDPQELRRTLKGELDWIVMKALEKDRTRRYESAAALSHDIGHHLNHEAVTAVAPSVGYRFHKFAQRHRTALTAALMVFAALVVGTIFSTWLAVRASLAEQTAMMSLANEKQARQQLERLRARAEAEARHARTEAATAEAVTRFLNEDLFAAADPENEPDREITLRSLLDRAAPALQEGHLTNQPLVAAAIHSTVGMAYRNLSLYTPATEHLQKAYDLRLAELGARHPDTLEASIALAGAIARNGQHAAARPLAEEALQRASTDLGTNHPLAIKCMAELAWIYYGLKMQREAFQLAEQAFAVARDTPGVDDGDLTGVMYLVGRYRGRADGGDFAAGEAVLKAAWDLMKQRHGPRHMRTLQAQAGVAAYYYDHARKLDEAERLLHDLLAKQRRMFGESHRWTVNTHDTLALLYRRQERHAEAVYHFLRVLEFRPDDRRALGLLPASLDRAPLPSLLSKAASDSWRLSTNPPPSDWLMPGFDDTSWESSGPFDASEAWFRNEFDLSKTPQGVLAFKINGWGDFVVFVNGVPMECEFGSAGGRYQIAVHGSDAIQALRVGRNVVAAHARNLHPPEPVRIEIVISSPPTREKEQR